MSDKQNIRSYNLKLKILELSDLIKRHMLCLSNPMCRGWDSLLMHKPSSLSDIRIELYTQMIHFSLYRDQLQEKFIEEFEEKEEEERKGRIEVEEVEK